LSDSKLYALKMQQQQSEDKASEVGQRSFSNVEAKTTTDETGNPKL
jgi:hypothetical protein